MINFKGDRLNEDGFSQRNNTVIFGLFLCLHFAIISLIGINLIGKLKDVEADTKLPMRCENPTKLNPTFVIIVKCPAR